ncbi:MAG: cytochrome b N-terminal domain-containing protein [Verrucomicrobia bacterium]|nr:cytochrome b N-terminal domain-containing protein [Verrucomicrobiota bacterium]
MKALLDWLDQRTGYRRIVRYSLYENIPGGARWRYVWGSTLVFTLTIQFITGLFLWMAYSPSSQTAWESVYFIQHEMTGGWLLRGIHHFTASVMNVLLVLHLMQVVIDGAYRAPREFNFWFGIGLLLLVLALSLTGYLLPWDQKGYWATKVATNIAAIVPVVGPTMQKLIIGGSDYGHHTLTRFFALHAGVLPATVILLLVWHIFLFRRHGITAKDPKRKPDEYFWPDQVLKDAVACLAVMATILFLVLRPWLFNTGEDVGAELAAPADPSETYSAARPEWYFLFLFEFLKFFPGGYEVWGAVVIPGFIMGVIFLMPIIGRWHLGHVFNVGLSVSLLVGVALLTYLAMTQDERDPAYQIAVQEAKRNAARVRELAQAPTGIPPAGAVNLLRDDPKTQGPKLFSKHCASCHRYAGHDGTGNKLKEEQTASDLKGFGGREWLTGLLDATRIASLQYYGGTKFKDGRMARFVVRDVAKYAPEEKEKLRKVILALSAEADLKSQRAAEERDIPAINQGRKLMASEEMRCTECHRFHDQGEDPTGPELTGYGSRDWLIEFISDPGHERFYGKRNDRMPAFGKDRLDAHAIGLLADWLRNDWYEAPASGTAARQASLLNQNAKREIRNPKPETNSTPQ